MDLENIVVTRDLDSAADRRQAKSADDWKLSQIMERLTGAGEREIDLTWRFVRGLTRGTQHETR